jgi:SagB-type dehydrogenase family enzyme
MVGIRCVARRLAYPLIAATIASPFACNRTERNAMIPAASAASDSSLSSGAATALPSASVSGARSLEAVLARRRSVRTYRARKLLDGELAQLLWAGQGITSALGQRTAPSAGALYPLTLYWIDERGIFRYEPSTHAITKRSDGDRRRDLARAAFDQTSIEQAPGVLAIVARTSITATKYGARSERYCALEAGHVAQNVLLEATALGLDGVPVGAFDDDAVRKVLTLDSGQVPLYLIPLGEAGG